MRIDALQRKDAADYCLAAAKYLRGERRLTPHRPVGAASRIVVAALAQVSSPVYDAAAYDAAAELIAKGWTP